MGLVNSSNIAITKVDARTRAGGKLCKRVSDKYGNDSIFQYSNTPNVARDMLSIIHAWDAWRTPEDAGSTPLFFSGDDTKDSHPSGLQKSEFDTGAKSTKGKLVYWGFSYGSLLGATFAAMFPDKVGRVILDG